MSDTLEDRNARAVVTTWRRGDHRQAWGPLRSDCPSEVTFAAAVEYGELANAADEAADHLAKVGYLSGHTVMRNLRGTASRFAAEATRLHAWGRALRRAEEDPDE